MNILFFGSNELMDRLSGLSEGQSWDLYRANDPSGVLDYQGTHVFHAALVELCKGAPAVRAAARNMETALNIPVTIGLSSPSGASSLEEEPVPQLDIVLTEHESDRLLKQQCDAVIRLANRTPSECVVAGGLKFEVDADRFSVHGETITLQRRKHKLLELLFLRKDRVVTKDMALNHLYGWEEAPGPKIIDVFVCQLRRTLREAGVPKDCIKTVWGQGYSLHSDEAASAKLAA